MAKRKKKKSNIGTVLWLLLLIVLLILMLVLFLTKIFKLRIGQEESAPSSAVVRKIKEEDFSVQDGRVTYPGADTGIDVSEYQLVIDWDAVKNDGISFAIIRLGFRGSSSGNLCLDEKFYFNLSGARAAGLDVGVYFYSQANSEEEAIEEAEYVIEALKGIKLECPVFYDWEEGSPRAERLEGITMKDVATFTNAFCDRIEESGYTAGAYFNQKYGYGVKLLGLKDYPFWLAEFHQTMKFSFDVQYWQYTYEGQVDGIETKVDLDLRFPLEETNEKNN